MKTIIISIRPEWACKILNGEKTIEVRKGLALYNALKKAEERGEEVEFLMYVTKDPKHPLARFEFSNGARYEIYGKNTHYACGCSGNMSDNLNGKVVAKFKAKAEEIKYEFVCDCYCEYATVTFVTESLSQRKLLKQSCLPYFDLRTYMGIKNERDGKSVGTALHISNLEIFDKPKELGEFVHPSPHCELLCDNNFTPSFCKDCCSHNRDPERLDVWCDRYEKWLKPLEKAPQSWCYAKEVRQ